MNADKTTRARARTAMCLAVLGALSAVGACGGQDDLCVGVTTECAPLYEPTFDNVFAQTLAPKCAVAGGACHAPEGASGGLILAEIEQAYGMLVGDNPDGRVRVDPDALGCGELLSRIGAESAARVMPPGAPLPAAERCAIAQWVEAGAAR